MPATRSILRDVALVGAYNTRQARRLEGHTTYSIIADAIRGAMADAGVRASDVNGLSVSPVDPATNSNWFVPMLGRQPTWTADSVTGTGQVLAAASAIAAGLCDVAVVAAGQAELGSGGGATAPWTRPSHAFVAPFGLYTAVEFALPARRHMHLYGTSERQMAEVAATIRNNGSINPGAVYYGKGPFTPDDILNSRPIADPFRVLDCSTVSEGGAAIVLARRDRAKDMRQRPVYIAGAALEANGQAYTRPPVWDETGMVGQWAARRAFAMAGLAPSDVDVCEMYDSFSFEIIRQFEAFGFCKAGEGGEFVMGGRIALDGQFPICTDGGTMSFSHPGTAQMLQKVIAGVHQLQGRAGARQVRGAEVALCSVAGAGALCNDVVLLSPEAHR